MRKRGDFSGLLDSNTIRTGAAKREDFFTTTVARLGLSLATFGRQFLFLFSIFLFISYFQFILEDD